MSPSEWNTAITRLPGAHLLQTEEWARVKLAFGWSPATLTWPEAACLVLTRTIPVRGFAARLKVLYAPRGPLLDWSDAPRRKAALDGLHDFARRQGAIFIKIDPEVPVGYGIPGQPGARENPVGAEVVVDLQRRGYQYSNEPVQFQNTVLVDLTASEDELLGRMKPKTRYNIRLAERKGVAIRTGTTADFPLLYRMYAETSLRDGFAIRSEEYYRTVWQTFLIPDNAEACNPNRPVCEPLIAEVEGQPVAAVIPFRFAGQAWYIYGMSLAQHREKMPNYLLQWEAMRRAKQAGCTSYDLWGAPDTFEESHPMWGVYRFKEGLGGEVVRTIGAWDLPIQPVLFRLYTQVIPRFLGMLRARGKRQVQQMIST